MSSRPRIEVFPQKDALIAAAADRVHAAITAALARSPQAFIALSGGSTPKPLYEMLSQRRDLDVTRIQFCFVDERNVGPDEHDSNFRMIREAWFAPASVPEKNIHRMRGELPAHEAGALYEEELRGLNIPVSGGFPRFDFMLMGIGPDGHTASLFPNTEALHERQRWAVGNHVPQMNTNRITLTYPVINNSAIILFLIAGADKASPVAAIASGTSDLPAAHVAPTAGEMIWLLDQAAAADLPRS